MEVLDIFVHPLRVCQKDYLKFLSECMIVYEDFFMFFWVLYEA